MTEVCAVVPAFNEAERITATVVAVRKLPHVTRVLVVDDGSNDSTAATARAAGAHVIERPERGGKGAAMNTAVDALRDEWQGAVVFLDADLQSTAGRAAPIIEAVVSGGADLAIGTLPPITGRVGFGLVVNTSRWLIRRTTGWTARQPLSGQRCLTAEALRHSAPFARGFAVETFMTIDVLRAGLTVSEVEVELSHRVGSNRLSSQLHRASQLRDIALECARRAMGRSRSVSR